MATRAQIRTMVRDQTLVESDDLSNATVDIYINEGIRRLAQRDEWPFLEKTADLDVTASTASVALPSDFYKVLAVVEKGGTRRVRKITLEDFLSTYGDNAPETSLARFFYLFDTNIHFVPTPSTTATGKYTMYYLKQITTLSDDGDTPEWTAEYHYVPAYYAISRLWEREEDFIKAADAMAMFDFQVEEMSNYYQNRTEDRGFAVGQPSRVRTNNIPDLDGV